MSLKKTRTDGVRQGVLLGVAYLSVSTNHFILPLTAKSHLDSLESHFQKVRKDNRKWQWQTKRFLQLKWEGLLTDMQRNSHWWVGFVSTKFSV